MLRCMCVACSRGGGGGGVGGRGVGGSGGQGVGLWCVRIRRHQYGFTQLPSCIKMKYCYEVR